ncbi:DUF2057 family protein [Marinomonas ostreistagni]|uniref:DUF2057 family protein n=1 Tax=Marinomonas ostreistagni TaxID=359209 RepID=UPI001952852D|nr:DUF2057 family protein [Marinomonas ostreistagni]MBM6552097.1 DUF2057 family protein [Marinomonas ostreistagni]
MSSWASAGALYLDKNIELLALDGKVVKAVNTTPRDLRSGGHQIVFRYSKHLRDGGREVEYETPPLLMHIDTLASDEIELLAPELNTLSQASLYFENRSVWRVKYGNGAVKTVDFEPLTEERLPKEGVQDILDQYNESKGTEFVRKVEQKEVNNDLLKSIQLLYLQANETQRESIKQWVLKQ